MEDLEYILQKTISRVGVQDALGFSSIGYVSTFFEFRKRSTPEMNDRRRDMKDKLYSGVLTVSEIVDEVLWYSSYHPSMISNILNRLGLSFVLADQLTIISKHIKREIGVINQDELTLQLISDSGALPVKIIANILTDYGEIIDRTKLPIYIQQYSNENSNGS